MPRYRFSWDAFADEVVEAFAEPLGYDPDEFDGSPRAFLEEVVKRPNATSVQHHKDVILDAWVACHEGTARYLFQRLADIGVGPTDYRPRSLKGYLRFLAGTRNAKNFRAAAADAMIAYGDRDRPAPRHSTTTARGYRTLASAPGTWTSWSGRSDGSGRAAGAGRRGSGSKGSTRFTHADGPRETRSSDREQPLIG